ncbi:MAG: hypothetical protein KF764_01970, partial [Labilithrix sp.]|nr:hypothetical protein [Labilithrix sp.]
MSLDPAEADVDVAGRPRPLESKLEDDASLHDGTFSEVLEDAGEESIEDENLPKARHARSSGSGADASLQRLPKGFRCCVALRRHLVSVG